MPSNINLAGDKLFNYQAPLEPGILVGPGEPFATAFDVPIGILFPGKRIYDKSNDSTYVVDKNLVPVLQTQLELEYSETLKAFLI